MDSILASMSILVKILLYRSQPTNSPIIPGLREINFLQHTMAAIMTTVLKLFPFTSERKFFSAPIIRLKGWCFSQSEKNFLLIDNGNLSKKTVIDDCSRIVCCKKLTKFSKNATVQFIGEFSGILKDDLKKVQKCNRPR